MVIRVGYTAIEVVLRRPAAQSQTKVGWLELQSIAQEKSAVKVSFAATQVLVKPKPKPSPAITSINTDVAISPQFGPPAITSINTDVMANAGRPQARIYNLNLEVATQGQADSQFTWMGIQALHSTQPAVQSNFTWMGLAFLVPAYPKISMSWLGVQALVDINSVDDIPDYMNFGSIFDVYPGAVKDSITLPITGMSPSYPIEIYSDSDILFTTNGVDFSPTIIVQLGDNLTLRKVVTSLFNQTFRLFVNSGFDGEQEIGMWQLPGPSGTLKYDEWLYREVDGAPWIEFKDQENQYASQSEAEFAEFQLLNSTAPTALPINNNDINYVDAPNGELVNDNDKYLAMAPVGDIWKTLSFLSIEDERIVELYKNYIHYVNHLITDNFIQTSVSDNKYFDVLLDNIVLYSNYFNIIKSPDQYSAQIENFNILRTVSKFYTVYQETDINKFQPYMEYWKNWENYLANTEWIYEYYNHSHIGPERIWVNYTLSNNVSTAPIWEHEQFGFGHLIEMTFLYGEIMNVARNILVNVDYGFESTRISYTNEILSSFESTENSIFPVSQLYYTYEHALANILVDLGHKFDREVIFTSTNYVRQGGFLTPELAENAAEAYPDNITVIYQQPEGTYSFEVIYDTALWCGDVPSNPLKAVAWYLGGG